MRKSWALAAVVAAVTTVGLSAEGRPPEPVNRPGSYVVASAEDSRTSVVHARIPVPLHQDPHAALPGTLPLLVVGSLLLGLGAAVRRTT